MDKFNYSNQKGYVIITALLVLIVVTLLGTWALKSSFFEIKISGNQQRWNKNFNISDGGVKKEASNLGYASSSYYSWYQISDPDKYNSLLLPPATQTAFDPGSDMTITSDYHTKFSSNQKDPLYWPHQNLLGSTSDDTTDYSYYVKYLYPDNPPKGYDSSSFSGYKFQIISNRNITVEAGGNKVGVKKN